ncbi:hypothetical protein MASR1M68_10180 [Elusimicrobiota bacterium]
MNNFKKHILVILSYFFISSFALMMFFINTDNKVIGNIHHSNAQGEIMLTAIMENSLLSGKITNWGFTDFLNYPYGQELPNRIKSNFHLYISGTIAVFTNPLISYNIMFFIIIILNAYGIFLLSQYVFKNHYLSWVAGLFYTFNPYVLLKINMGSLHKGILFFIPLYILFLLKSLDNYKITHVAITFFFLALTYLQYPMYALYCLLFSIILIIYRLFENKKIKELQYFIIISGLSFIFLYWANAVGNVSFAKFIYTENYLALNPLYFIKNYMPQPASIPTGISPLILLLGLLGFIYKKEARFFFLTGIFYIILSFGFFVNMYDTKILLPFYFLATIVKFFSNTDLYASVRCLSVAYICLILSAVFFIKILYTRFGKKSIFIIFGLFIFELTFLYSDIFPVKTTYMPEFNIVSQIKNKNGNILYLPLSIIDNDKIFLHKLMLITAMSNKKMANSYESESWIKKIIEKESAENVLKKLKENNISFIVLYGTLQSVSKEENIFINLIKEKSIKTDKEMFLYEIN